MTGPIEIQCEQGDDLWRACRLGIPTASEFGRIVTPGGKLSSQRDGYLHELLAEWVLGYAQEIPSNYWIERGSELEHQARDWYEFQTDRTVRRVGFAYRDEARLVGCSPDWMIDPDGGAEVKCPKASTHVGYLLGVQSVPTQYVPQVQGSLWVTGRRYWEFVSYHPEMPTQLVRVDPDPDYQAALDRELPKFLAALLEGRERLKSRGVQPKEETPF